MSEKNIRKERKGKYKITKRFIQATDIFMILVEQHLSSPICQVQWLHIQAE